MLVDTPSIKSSQAVNQTHKKTNARSNIGKTDRATNRKTDRYIERQTNRWTDSQTDKTMDSTGTQKDKQTNGNLDSNSRFSFILARFTRVPIVL